MPRAAQFKLLKSKTILRSRVFAVRDERWRAPDSSMFQRHTIVHPGAVAILPIDGQGRMVLIRQFRPAVRDWLLEIPAGTLEQGERPLACARRELIEETGFAARRWKKLGAVYTAPGFCTEKIHLFLAWDLKPAFAEKDEDEHIQLAVMNAATVRRAIRTGRIRDAKTLSTLLLSGRL